MKHKSYVGLAALLVGASACAELAGFHPPRRGSGTEAGGAGGLLESSGGGGHQSTQESSIHGDCAAGTKPTASGSCEPCAVGTYCAAGTDHATPCPDGTWDADQDPGTACVPWSNCPAGTHIDNTPSATIDRHCTDCASGSQAIGINQASCTACPPNTYSGQRASACATCPAGTYSEQGAIACKPICTTVSATAQSITGAPTSAIGTPASIYDDNNATSYGASVSTGTGSGGARITATITLLKPTDLSAIGVVYSVSGGGSSSGGGSIKVNVTTNAGTTQVHSRSFLGSSGTLSTKITGLPSGAATVVVTLEGSGAGSYGGGGSVSLFEVRLLANDGSVSGSRLPLCTG